MGSFINFSQYLRNYFDLLTLSKIEIFSIYRSETNGCVSWNMFGDRIYGILSLYVWESNLLLLYVPAFRIDWSALRIFTSIFFLWLNIGRELFERLLLSGAFVARGCSLVFSNLKHFPLFSFFRSWQIHETFQNICMFSLKASAFSLSTRLPQA